MASSERERDRRALDFFLAEHGHHDPDFAPSEPPIESGEPIGFIEFNLETWDVTYHDAPKKG